MRKSILADTASTRTRWISPHRTCALPVWSPWSTRPEPPCLMQWWNVGQQESGWWYNYITKKLRFKICKEREQKRWKDLVTKQPLKSPLLSAPSLPTFLPPWEVLHHTHLWLTGKMDSPDQLRKRCSDWSEISKEQAGNLISSKWHSSISLT